LEPVLGISTCWWHGKVDRGDEIVGEVLDEGLTGIELDYRISPWIYQQMKPLLGKSIAVISIHNFFPVPEDIGIREGGGNLFLLSSEDRDERSLAVQLTIRTIEHAHDIEAQAVVLHLGSVDMPDPTGLLRAHYKKESEDEGTLRSLVDEQRRIRLEKRQRNLDNILFSLDKLNREADKRSVFLAVENRYHFHEMPDFEEIGLILDTFRGGALRYWHDVGHARVQENLGIVNQSALLTAYAGDLVGIHLHDVRGLDDHLPPGKGEVDFDKLLAEVPAEAVRVLEVQTTASREELREGIRLLQDKGV
jgi:sugar phosphate isomerase/epimerase